MGGEVRTELIKDKIGVQTVGMGWEQGRDLCHMIPGGRWNRTEKLWEYPKDYQVCIAIREAATAYHAVVRIGPDLNDWARSERARIEALPDLSKVHEVTDLPKIRQNYPKIWEAVQSRPFQTGGIKFIVENREVLLADDPGLGKTIQTIGAVVESYDEGLFLVMAPKSAANITWPAQLKHWSPGDTVINLANLAATSNKRPLVLSNPDYEKWEEEPIFVEAPSPRENLLAEAEHTMENGSGRVWVIINSYWVKAKPKTTAGQKAYVRGPKGEKIIDYKLPMLHSFQFDGVVVDESHDAIICRTANRLKHTQTRFGLDELPLAENALKVALSGTPMRGKAENLWGTLNWLKPKIFTSYYKWMEKHFKEADETDEEYNPYSEAKVFTELIDEGKLWESIKTFAIRRTKAEVASDLPPKLYAGEGLEDVEGSYGVWLDLLPGQRKQYDAMAADGEVDDIIANGVLAEWTRLKQFANAQSVVSSDGVVIPAGESNKLEWLRDFFEERGVLDGSGNNKIIVASQFSKFIDFIATWMELQNVPFFKLTGSTKTEDRIAMADRFQESGGPKVFLLTTKAGGVSLTLDAADDVVIMDETWIPDDQLQVEDRAHRLSRPDHNVTIWYIRSKGTIEEAIARVNAGRSTETLGIMDRSRGVSIEKQIAKELEKIK